MIDWSFQRVEVTLAVPIFESVVTSQLSSHVYSSCLKTDRNFLAVNCDLIMPENVADCAVVTVCLRERQLGNL